MVMNTLDKMSLIAFTLFPISSNVHFYHSKIQSNVLYFY